MQREESKSFLPRFDRILLDGMEDLFAPRPAAGRLSSLPTAAEHRAKRGNFLSMESIASKTGHINSSGGSSGKVSPEKIKLLRIVVANWKIRLYTYG